MATGKPKAEDAQDEFHDRSLEEDPKKPKKMTGNKASTEASIPEGTPIPGDVEDQDAAEDQVKAVPKDEAREDGQEVDNDAFVSPEDSKTGAWLKAVAEVRALAEGQAVGQAEADAEIRSAKKPVRRIKLENRITSHDDAKELDEDVQSNDSDDE